jgi:RNA polymerase sigma-70 factor (ECF subfamily)
MGNHADAADSAQNAMISIVKNLARFDGRAAFSTWAYRIATNSSLDELRKRSRRAEPGLDEREKSDQVVLHAARLEEISQVETSDEVQSALNQLTDDFRAPVVLRDLLGYDYAEIASILDIRPGTVRSRIARGRAALREILGNQRPSANVQVDDHE